MKQLPAIFAFPTESFYAIGVQATNRKAIQHLFRAKHREPGKPVALIAANVAQVKRFFVMTAAEERLAKQYWPGSLTILLKPKKTIAARALGATRIGVRVPRHSGARRLARKLGTPITATSANISGQRPTKSARRVRRDFPGILVLPGRCGRQTQPSTVASLKHEHITILRQGSVHLPKVF